MHKALKIILLVLLLPVVLFMLMILYATLDDYRPQLTETVSGSGNSTDTMKSAVVINMLSWNIGYCGLDQSMDFFYDGGTKVRTPREQLDVNFRRINDFLNAQDSVSIMLLQEVDLKSKRSYRINQVEKLTGIVPKFNAWYGKNYDV